MKPDCYQCVHRRPIPGDEHSRCFHPAAGETVLQGTAATIENGVCIAINMAGVRMLGIEANVHGISSGWFNWPFNYDPVWLLKCDGFTVKN